MALHDRPQKKKPAQASYWVPANSGQPDNNGFFKISRKTKDASTYVNLLNITDNLMYAVRMNVGILPQLNGDLFTHFLDRAEAIRQDLNKLNAELCQALNKDYHPPRGFSNPLAPVEVQQESME